MDNIEWEAIDPSFSYDPKQRCYLLSFAFLLLGGHFDSKKMWSKCSPRQQEVVGPVGDRN